MALSEWIKRKRCAKCGKTKPLVDFRFKPNEPGNHRRFCRECQFVYLHQDDVQADFEDAMGWSPRTRSEPPATSPDTTITQATPEPDADTLTCAACGFTLPRKAFSTFLTHGPLALDNGTILTGFPPRPHVDGDQAASYVSWSHKRTTFFLDALVKPYLGGSPDPQRCDACLGERVCAQCNTVFEIRPRQQDPTYIKERKRTKQPQTFNRPAVCFKCAGDFRILSADELALVQRLAAPPTPPTTDPTTPSADALTLGTSPSGDPITITDTDRTRHVYLIGGTGSGKSVTLTNLATQDLRAGRGFTVIDPHGDLAQGLLARVPPDELARVTYFDPSHEDAPSFNLLASDFPPDKLTADLVATFKMFFGDSWGHQMEHLLRNAFLTLLADRHHEPHTFADVRQLLTDRDYREGIVNRSAPDYAAFWHEEFPQLTKDAARPILTRLGSVLVPGSAIKRAMSNPANELDVKTTMDSGRVLLVNLSKGALGEQPSRLLGGLIVTAITQAALARQSQPEKDRTPHTLYCDEFQNFADLPSTESILSEARKYQLRLVLAHQTMSQVSGQLMGNILGNVRTLVAFRVSPDDASKLARAMGRTRHVYPDTGEVYDLATQRRTIAQTFLENLTTYVNNRAAVPRYSAGYGRKGFTSTGVNDALTWLNTVADLDPSNYDPGQPAAFKWKTSTWPTAQDFQNLPTCHAFIMRNVATSTAELRVPFPPSPPHPDNLDQWHERRAAEIAAQRAAEEKRRAQKPQDERKPTGTTLPLHQNSTTLAEEPPHPPPAPTPPDDPDDFLN